MMDAAEARANAQRKRKLGLSCTQDQEQQEEAGVGWKGSSVGRWALQSCCFPTVSAHCPASAPSSERIFHQCAGQPWDLDLQSTQSLVTYEPEGNLGLPVHHCSNFNHTHPSGMHFAILIYHMNYYLIFIFKLTPISFFLRHV